MKFIYEIKFIIKILLSVLYNICDTLFKGNFFNDFMKYFNKHINHFLRSTIETSKAFSDNALLPAMKWNDKVKKNGNGFETHTYTFFSTIKWEKTSKTINAKTMNLSSIILYENMCL